MAKDSIDEKTHLDPVNEVEIRLETAGTFVAEQQPVAESTIYVTSAQPSERQQVVRSASLVMLGNLGSSVMGLVRQIVLAATGRQIASAFQSALLPAQTFNDLIINGSIQGALVPTFNDHAAPEKRDELRRLVFTLVNLIIIVMFVAAILFAIFSPQFISFIVDGYQQSDKVLTLNFARIIFFSLVALGPFAVLMAALYAMKEFGWPAFATAAAHMGIILGAVVGSLLGERYNGHYGLAFGVLLGALGEIALLIPGMRNQHFKYLLVLDLRHPALRRILRLYAPVAFSFLVSMMVVFIDQKIAAGAECARYVQGVTDCGEANFSAMRFATTLVQFPIGLVAMALSIAVLPTLSEHAREGNNERYKETLLLGFRLGLLLMIPAAAGLIALRLPIVSLIFRHHNYTTQDTTLTALALQNYAYQLPFVAMDQLLISAFYARKNTLIPVIVGIVCVFGYLGVALPLGHTFGAPILAFANTVQNSLHAIILLVILRFTIGSMHVRKTVPTVLKIVLATAVMVAVAVALQALLGHISLFSLDKLTGQLLTVAVAGGLSAAVYVGVVLVLKVEEVGLVKNAVLTKLGRK